MIHSLLVCIMELLRDRCPTLNGMCRNLLWAAKAITGRRQPLSIPRGPSDFGVDRKTGFIPSRPLPKLRGAFKLWEDALQAKLGRHMAEDYRAGERLTSSQWPVLDAMDLVNHVAGSQRAHYVLAYLIHYYVHSMPCKQLKKGTSITIPPSLAAPMMVVARHLRMAPVLTYADTILWNMEQINEDGPMTLDNLRTETLFSGTEDESAFYMSQVQCELLGAELLGVIADVASMHCSQAKDATSIALLSGALDRLTDGLEELDQIIKGIRPTCDPSVFYWRIRPWFVGSSEDHPWIFQGEDACIDLLGPSGGQSSLMHAVDVFLDVDHELRFTRSPAASNANRRADTGFMKRMRRYMPGPHRDYLQYLEQTPIRVRELAEEVPMLKVPYDGAVAALKRLRDSHMRIAVLYVVSAARILPTGCPLAMMVKAMEAKGPSDAGHSIGTGGSEVATLLKAGRDATRRAMLKDN
ncbi:Indoleamine 2,3-dioxygenase [Schizophyllum amplum]|uniref:Indoleamine 2,3-dioxygenase n=1 Tax=Schizophyllum amplum TaxID=97359 RepID=A0A550C3B6_9AGAR|nr:Indoleamine 2,3-dioxygenase [Auriculariopsis ampla]